jgi:cell wall-associated NlpC family hydrolase
MVDLTQYVGIPYVDKGTDPARGLDCWQLVRLFYRTELGKEIPDYLAFYRSSFDKVDAQGVLMQARGDWVPVAPPRFGDLLLFRTVASPWHVAIALDDGLMLHSDEGHGSVIERRDGVRWRDRLYGAYRWKY